MAWLYSQSIERYIAGHDVAHALCERDLAGFPGAPYDSRAAPAGTPLPNGVICLSWQQIYLGVSHAGAQVDVEVGEQLPQI